MRPTSLLFVSDKNRLWVMVKGGRIKDTGLRIQDKGDRIKGTG